MIFIGIVVALLILSAISLAASIAFLFVLQGICRILSRTGTRHRRTSPQPDTGSVLIERVL